MPRRDEDEKPPEAMTRGKRLPIVVVAGVFDAIRLFFEFFMITGPALAALWCTSHAGDTLDKWTFGLLGLKTAALACSAGAAAIGAAGSEITMPLGAVMSAVVGLIGFLVLGLWIVMTNARLFKVMTAAPIWFVGAFALTEIPFIGAIPVYSIILWRLYGSQIRIEQAALKQWEADHAARLRQRREEQAAQLAQVQQARLAQAEQEQQEQEAANDELYAQAEAADDAQYAQKIAA